MVFVILQITNNVKLKAMKNVLLILTLCVGMVACSGGKTKSADENAETKRNLVEVLLFHGAQSCASCKAIERTTEELLEEYKEAIERGDVIYSNLDLIDHEARAEKYGIIWSSLLVIDYDNDGNEKVTDLTDHAYTDVMTDSERLKTRLRTAINNYLKE